jgi:hypothetical protein
MKISYDTKIIGRGIKVCGLYMLNDSTIIVMLLVKPHGIVELWDFRLIHVSDACLVPRLPPSNARLCCSNVISPYFRMFGFQLRNWFWTLKSILVEATIPSFHVWPKSILEVHLKFPNSTPVKRCCLQMLQKSFFCFLKVREG